MFTSNFHLSLSIGFTFQVSNTARDGNATTTSARNIHFDASRVPAMLVALSMMTSAISLKRLEGIVWLKDFLEYY